MQGELEHGWAEFLQEQGYDCFFTVTFRDPAHSPEAAIWRAKTFLIRYFEGRCERVKAFIVAEPHELGFYHVHGLLDSHGSFELRRSLWSHCFNRHGRCRFEPFESSEAVAVYVMKYCVKQSSSWEMIGGVSLRAKTV
jgi:hypothetical protein